MYDNSKFRVKEDGVLSEEIEAYLECSKEA